MTIVTQGISIKLLLVMKHGCMTERERKAQDGAWVPKGGKPPEMAKSVSQEGTVYDILQLCWNRATKTI